MRISLFMVCHLIGQFIFGQVKDEREMRLKKEELPSIILESVEDYLELSKKVRFYSEMDNEKKSFEVKLIFKGNKYSIEFDEKGKLEDIEKTIPYEAIPESTIKNIEEYLDSFDKHRIDKVQKQFSSSSKENREIIEEALVNQTADIIRYEIEMDVKQDGKWTSYEVLFSDDGEFILKREIIHRSSDFILY